MCQSIFPHVLDTVLESHEWAFAKARTVLTELLADEAMNHEYQFRYALPADCIKPIRVVMPQQAGAMRGNAFFFEGINRSPAYVIEGQYILCNVPQAELLYVARVSEPRHWPAYFANALVWKMAAGLATLRNNDKQQKQMCEQMYEHALAAACAKDRAMQNERKMTSAWQDARGNRMMRGWR